MGGEGRTAVLSECARARRSTQYISRSAACTSRTYRGGSIPYSPQESGALAHSLRTAVLPSPSLLVLLLNLRLLPLDLLLSYWRTRRRALLSRARNGWSWSCTLVLMHLMLHSIAPPATRDGSASLSLSMSRALSRFSQSLPI